MKRPGCPLAPSKEREDDASQSSMTTTADTDLDSEYAVDNTPKDKVVTSGLPSPQHCVVCTVDLPSKKALAFHLKQIVVTSGLPSPQHCVVCTVDLPSKKALAFHLKQIHLESRSYTCSVCQKTFNCQPDLSTHHYSVHSLRSVKCKHCPYSTISKS